MSIRLKSSKQSLCYAVRAAAKGDPKRPQCATFQTKAIKQYFHVVLFIMLYKVVLTIKSVDETLVCDHSNESY